MIKKKKKTEVIQSFDGKGDEKGGEVVIGVGDEEKKRVGQPS